MLWFSWALKGKYLSWNIGTFSGKYQGKLKECFICRGSEGSKFVSFTVWSVVIVKVSSKLSVIYCIEFFSSCFLYSRVQSVHSNLSSSIFMTLPPPYLSGVTGNQWAPGSVKVCPGHCQQRHVGTHNNCPLPRDKDIAMWNLAPHLSDRQSRLVIGQLWVHWCWGQTPVCNEAALEPRLE